MRRDTFENKCPYFRNNLEFFVCRLFHIIYRRSAVQYIFIFDHKRSQFPTQYWYDAKPSHERIRKVHVASPFHF